MPNDWILYVCLFLALWSAVVGGVFSAFSEFIMKALERARPETAIEAMQQINRTVIRTQFVAGILLIGPLGLGLAAAAFATYSGLVLVLFLLAPAIYLVTVIVTTVLGNVPKNNHLDSLDHHTIRAAAYWETYSVQWTRLNHIRSAGSVVTAAIYLAAAIAMINTGQVSS